MNDLAMKNLGEIQGALVSMDVSTGEDNATHRIFGRVSEVMLKECGSAEDTILATEESRNFKSAVNRELLQSAMTAFGKLGGNRVGGEYRSEWEQCRDALFTSSQPAAESIPDLTTEQRGKVPEHVWQLAEKVWRDLDRESCPGVYMQITSESIIKHYQAPAALTPRAWQIDFGRYGQITLRKDEADQALSIGAKVEPLFANALPTPVTSRSCEEEQWRDGAKFALRAVGNLDSLFFLTDSMKIAAIESATKTVIAERDRRARLTQEAS